MSIGGRSLHKEDWLKLGLAAAGTAAGFGAAGMGPLAGLLGGAEGAAAGALGAAAPGEAIGAFTGTAAQLPGAGGLLGAGKGALKGLEALQKAQTLVALAQGPQGQQQMAQPRPQPAMPMHGDAMKLWQQIYGGMT